MGDCPLCDLANGDIKTRLYYTDDVCIVVDCLTCGTPMMVLRAHRRPYKEEFERMTQVLGEHFRGLRWRGVQRQNRDHWHEHLI